MLMVDAFELPAAIEGNSGFTEHFESLGPFDSDGRSLREFDLNSRVFRYPLSYLIYSNGFDALPSVAKTAVFRRLNDILSGMPETDGFTKLSLSDRVAISEILAETLPEFVQSI